MYNGIDTAARITPRMAQILRHEGVSFVVRYLVPQTGTTAWKALTAAEAADIRNAGLALMLCWETSAERAKGGASAGAADGLAARELAEAIGVPAGTAIYFAVDFDAQDDDMDAIEAYFRAARIGVGKYNAGIYGGQRVVTALANATAWLWQCVAWSNQFMPYATVRQYQWQGGADAKALTEKIGVAVDLDSANTLAGMWMPATANQEGETIMQRDWKKFLIAAGIRALRTLAQTAIATIGTTALLEEVNWAVVGSASALAAVLSLLTSIATGLPEVEE